MLGRQSEVRGRQSVNQTHAQHKPWLFTVKLPRISQQCIQQVQIWFSPWWLDQEDKIDNTPANMQRERTFQCDKITEEQRETEMQSTDEEVTHILSVFACKLYEWACYTKCPYLLLWVSRLAGNHTVTGAPGKCVLTVPQPLKDIR